MLFPAQGRALSVLVLLHFLVYEKMLSARGARAGGGMLPPSERSPTERAGFAFASQAKQISPENYT